MSTLSDSILMCLAGCSEPISLAEMARQLRVSGARLRPVVDKLTGESRVSYNKTNKTYSQGLVIGRSIPLPPSSIGKRTCAFDGWRDATELTEHDGRMVAACTDPRCAGERTVAEPKRKAPIKRAPEPAVEADEEPEVEEHSYASDGACDACGEPDIGGFGCRLAAQSGHIDALETAIEDLG